MNGARVTRYPSISAIRIRDMSSRRNAPREPRAKLRFDLRQRSVADLLFRNEHEIETAGELALVAPEAFAQEPLRPVPHRGAPHPAACSQAHSRKLQLVFDDEQREKGP